MRSAWETSSYDGTHLEFGGILDRRCHFKHVSLKTKAVLTFSNEHDSQVNDQRRRQCYHNKHKKFSYRPTCDVCLFSRHISYFIIPSLLAYTKHTSCAFPNFRSDYRWIRYQTRIVMYQETVRRYEIVNLLPNFRIYSQKLRHSFVHFVLIFREKNYARLLLVN